MIICHSVDRHLKNNPCSFLNSIGSATFHILRFLSSIASPLPKFEVKRSTFSWCFGFSDLVYSFLPFFSTSNAKLSGSWNAAPSKIRCRERNYLKLYSIGWFDLSICFGQSDPIFIETVLVWPTMAISHLLIFSATCQLSTTSANSLRDLGISRNSIASLFRSIITVVYAKSDCLLSTIENTVFVAWTKLH